MLENVPLHDQLKIMLDVFCVVTGAFSIGVLINGFITVKILIAEVLTLALLVLENVPTRFTVSIIRISAPSSAIPRLSSMKPAGST